MQTRRAFIRTGLAAGAGLGAATGFGGVIDQALAVSRPKRPSLDDIEHVVILMQENRSFDHYFGTLRGVRGYGDKNFPVTNGRPCWNQLDPDLANNPQGYVLPLRLDSQTTAGQCVVDQSHAWSVQHASWDSGKMDHFVAAHEIGNGAGPASGPFTMGYYTRADIPFHYALADAFTICDGYHCSVFGPTNPNRIISMSGTVDPEGAMGGPALDDSTTNGQLHWTSYPERLQAAGISWFVYQENDNDTNNMLPFFAGINSAPKTSQLYQRANTYIPTPKGAQPGPALLARLRHDVQHGKLPQVSWILASTANCEHPTAQPNVGANFIAGVLAALTSNKKVWSKTVMFLTYDENDGFFDHVPPPTAPPGTPGEYVTQQMATKVASQTDGFAGPVGLGMRVPLTVISPFSPGGMVCNETFDHSSLLRFLERRYGVSEPNISAWRRGVSGDLTATLGCLGSPSVAFPRLPATAALAAAAITECAKDPAPTIPAHQAMPVQEPGTRPQAGRACVKTKRR